MGSGEWKLDLYQNLALWGGRRGVTPISSVKVTALLPNNMVTSPAMDFSYLNLNLLNKIFLKNGSWKSNLGFMTNDKLFENLCSCNWKYRNSVVKLKLFFF